MKSTHASMMLAQAFGGVVFLATTSLAAQEQASQGDERSSRVAIVVAGKVGGIVPFSKLTTFVNGAVEAGCAFGPKRSLLAYLEASYTVPTADGSNADERVPGGKWRWELWQKQLVLQPTFAYRFTGLSAKLTPYVGVGPRLYLLETVTEGKAGGEDFGTTTEQSTKLGVGLPLGAEYQVGPGGILGELQLQWAPLDHRITGDTNLGAATLFVGYRAYL